MIEGHGDDAYHYTDIRSNFSSNVYSSVDHSGLKQYLVQHLDDLRTYPEPEPRSLEALLARHLSLSADQVCVTNGATEAIYLIAQAYRMQTSAVWMPTFSEYADACRLHGHRVLSVYGLDRLPAGVRLVWLCNPNNPTGEVRNREQLLTCVREHPQCLFVIDQSYEAFTRSSLLAASEAVALPNVLLLHSCTKRYAIPGLRLGYVTGAAELLQELRNQRMPWSVNALALAAGTYLLEHPGEASFDLEALLQEKARLTAALQEVGGLEVWPSDTHYFLVQLRMGKAAALKDFLVREYGLLIRDASNFEGLDERFFRIATQTPDANDRLVAGIRTWMYEGYVDV